MFRQEATISNSSDITTAARPGHRRRFAMFGGVGLVNTAVDFAVFAVLVFLSLHPVLANIGAFLAANTGSYFLNAQVTFRNEEGAAKTSKTGYLKFFSSHVVSLAISTAIVAALASLIGALAAKVIAAAVTLVWNYLASAFFVFRHTVATKTKTERESL